MAKREYTIAEATALPGGLTRYVVEYEREGNGTQRPTFEYPSEMPLKRVASLMKAQIEAERALNERSGRNGESVGEQVADLVGKQF